MFMILKILSSPTLNSHSVYSVNVEMCLLLLTLFDSGTFAFNRVTSRKLI